MGICADHFKDNHIKSFINSNITEVFCDYCDDLKPSAEFDLFHDFVSAAVYSEYCEPYEAGAGYNSEEEDYEDRFPGLTVHWTRYLLDELLDTEDYEIVEDLAANFDDDYLALSEEISGPTKNDYFIRGWKMFREVIKHKIRFLFFAPGIDSRFTEEESETLNPAYVLEEIRNLIIELDLIVTTPPYSLCLYRARQHKINENVCTAAKLGSPPPAHAKANRMSPPGISMFYAALDIETCRLEIIDKTKKNTAITIGEFTNIKDLKIVDFTNIGPVPSLFDEVNRHKRSVMGFLLSFVKDLSIPVQPDDSVHVDYIPTQVVTEYLRIKLDCDGILYNSVKNEGKQSVVIFAEYGQVFNATEELNKGDFDAPGFFVERDNKVLILLNDSVVTELI